MATVIRLPAPFADLEEWTHLALPTEDARMRARLVTPMEDLVAFYNVMLPRMEEAATYLDQWPLAELPDSAKPLLHLALMFMEAAMSVEFFKTPDVPEALGAEHMTVYPGRSEQILQ